MAGVSPSCFPSSLLVASVWMRLQLNESPAFRQMKKQGRGSLAPVSEAFGTWRNAKIALIALFGGTAGQAAVWYTGQFYALFFLTASSKSTATTANLAGRGLAHSRRAVFPVFRLAFGSGRPQADHPRRLPARRPALFPDLQGPDATPPIPALAHAQDDVAGDGDRRSGAMLLPVRPDRQRRLRHLLRSRQECSRQFGGELFQCRGAGRVSIARITDRRQGDCVVRRRRACRRTSWRQKRAAFEAEVLARDRRPPAIPPPPTRRRSTSRGVLGLLSLLVILVAMAMARSRRSWSNCSRPASATRRCRCPITSAMAGLAASCRRSPSPWSRPAAIFISACGIRLAWR